MRLLGPSTGAFLVLGGAKQMLLLLVLLLRPLKMALESLKTVLGLLKTLSLRRRLKALLEHLQTTFVLWPLKNILVLWFLHTISVTRHLNTLIVRLKKLPVIGPLIWTSKAILGPLMIQSSPVTGPLKTQRLQQIIPRWSMGTHAGVVLTVLLLLVGCFGDAYGSSDASSSPGGGLANNDFHHRAELDQRGNFLMLWTPLEESIIIEVQVATAGYVGLGFSEDGGMTGADVVLGWVDSDGLPHLQDRYAFGQLTPSVDTSQDYQLLRAYQNDTHTVVRLSRPWLTCDTQHDHQLTGDTVRVLWSYHAQDPPTGTSRLPKHDYRGVRSLYLRDPHLASSNNPQSHLRHWDVLSPQVALPDNIPTLYWCKLYRIPRLNKKAHIVGYIPVITVEGAPHVHHMLLYECHIRDSDQLMERFVSARGAQCYDHNMPYSWSACNTPIVAWAVGSEGEMYPDHVGIPMGEEHGGATYFMLEIHYNNPNLRSGVVDSSGVRVLYTEELRQHDAGILTLGHMLSPTLIVPPSKSWNTVAYCSSQCTHKTLPSGGIKAFLGFLHMHLLGSSISVQLIRNGRELPPIMKDMNYDFNYQQARVLKEEVEILPGDSFIVNCGYDATKRRTPTFGGFSTEDEMCLAFLTYYPRVELSGCYSTPDLALILHTLGIHHLHNNSLTAFGHPYFSDDIINEEYEQQQLGLMEKGGTTPLNIHLADIYRLVTVTAPHKYYNRSVHDILYDPETWTDTLVVSTLQEMITYGQYQPACEYHGRREVPGLPHKEKYPAYIPLRPEPQRCQPAPSTTSTTTTTTITPSPPSTAPSSSKPGNTGDADTVTVPWANEEENEVDHKSLTQQGKAHRLTVTAYLFIIPVIMLITLIL